MKTFIALLLTLITASAAQFNFVAGTNLVFVASDIKDAGFDRLRIFNTSNSSNSVQMYDCNNVNLTVSKTNTAFVKVYHVNDSDPATNIITLSAPLMVNYTLASSNVYVINESFTFDHGCVIVATQPGKVQVIKK